MPVSEAGRHREVFTCDGAGDAIPKPIIGRISGDKGRIHIADSGGSETLVDKEAETRLSGRYGVPIEMILDQKSSRIPAACGSKLDETAHQPNEYCIIDNMVGDAKVFGHIFLQD